MFRERKLTDDFCWKGIWASQMGVIVTQQVQYHRPALRREAITVPGRSGTLRLLGNDAYEDIVYAPACAIVPEADCESVWVWLCGRGEVIFGSMLDYVFDAELSEAFDCSALAEGHPGSYTIFTPIFTCNPLRRSAIAEPMTEISPTGAAGFNQGNIAAYPRIELAIPEAGEVTLTIAGNALRVQVSGAGNLVLDMETGIVCDETGAPSPIAREMSGSRLTLPVGEWNLSLTGNVTGGAMDVRTRWV